MLFNSWHFAIFFPIVTLAFFLLPHRFRNAFLLAASCYFYMAFVPQYILILLALNVIDFYSAKLIDKREGQQRKIFLIGSLIANVLFLSYYKYFNFLNDNFKYLADLFQVNYPIPHLDIILPIGLSFHTLQSMGYVIDVYRRKIPVENNFIKYSLYVTFFPQMVAGPIERAKNLLPQFDIVQKFDLQRTISGLQLMAVGFFKKIVIADTVVIITVQTFKNPAAFSGPELLLGSSLFVLQIYCDFSGYTDIGRGAARVMGFHMMENFIQPFHSQSFTEFWRRWHISMSTWFKDYVYTPLAESWNIPYVKVIAAIISFAISGLWHGANWTYVIWGLANGMVLMLLTFTKDFRKDKFIFQFKYLNMIATASTFMLTGIVFRAESVGLAMVYYTGLFSNWSKFDSTKFGIEGTEVLVISVFLLVSIYLIDKFQAKPQLLKIDHPIKRWSLYYTLGLFFVLLSYFSLNLSSRSHHPFIYFQF
jgi:alginate O-acetyltransferase complex protein AlgI